MKNREIDFRKNPFRGIFKKVGEEMGKHPHNIAIQFWDTENPKVRKAVLKEAKKRLDIQAKLKAEVKELEKKVLVA